MLPIVKMELCVFSTQLIGVHQRTNRVAGKQTKLLLSDAVLHITPSEIPLPIYILNATGTLFRQVDCCNGSSKYVDIFGKQ